MSEESKNSETIRQLAEQAGLGRAFKLAPEIVTACVERGQSPFSRQPAALTPLTAPAPVFDPAEFEPKK
jgi:hypothetical protein